MASGIKSRTGGTLTGKGTGNSKPPRRTQAERTEQTRTQILDVSAQLIRKRGVGGLRTQEVAELAGVSQGAQFHHFPTKDDLVIATFDHINARFLERSRWQASEKNTLAEVFTHIIEDAFDFYFSDAFYLDLAFGLDGQNPLLDRISKPTRKARFQAEAAWCNALEAAGLSKATATDVLAMTISLIRGFGVRHFMEKDKAKFVRLGAYWQQIILDFLASQGESPAPRKSRPKRATG